MSDMSLDPEEFLTRERLLKALGAARSDLLTPIDPATRRQQAEHPDLALTDEERSAISLALTGSYRLVSRFAYRTLERYDDLYARDRAEALDLFADIVRYPYFAGRGVVLPPPQREIGR